MLKNIVFDLDGTLWQTSESYVYAYQKLCDYYKIENRVSDEKVKDYLGVKLDKLLDELFPQVEDKLKLAYEALNFSVEYIIKHPEKCCFPNVKQVIEKLSEKYDVYIVSNCLMGYVETFMNVVGTKPFIKEYFTIEKGEKSQHLSKIASLSEEKTLFIGDCDDDYLSITDNYKIFFCYATYGYKDCIFYDYKINSIIELLDVINKIEIKERQLINKKYKVFSYKDNQLTLIKNTNGTSYFGFVKYVDENFSMALNSLLKENTQPLLGPIDGNTFYPYRFAVDNFDLKFYPDCDNGKEVVDCFLNNGFNYKQFYVTTIANVNYKMWNLAKKVRLPEGYSVKVVSGKDAYAYLDDIYEISIEAFAEADFYEEISKKDFLEIYMKNIELVSPDLVLIFYNGEVVAYNFCYEDPLKRYYVCKTTAIKKAHRNKRLIMVLIDYSYTLLVEKGYKLALHHFQNERTKTLQAIFNGNEILKKHYALLELKNEK